MIDPELANKVVLITGANHGIGAATAKAFAAQGARVFVTFFRGPADHPPDELARALQEGVGGVLLYHARHQQSADGLLAEIRASGGFAEAREADLTVLANIPMLFDECEKTLGPVDILVNNHTHCELDTIDPARVTAEGFGVHLLSAAGIDAHFAANSRAFALLMLEYLRRYLARGANHGRIINVSTDAAHCHEAALSYAASKHAIESYTRSAAAELGKYGITVNVVAAGPIQTGYLTPDQVAAIAAGTPLRGIGEPEHVADVIVFLASRQARWLTGQLLYAGGGWRMHQ